MRPGTVVGAVTALMLVGGASQAADVWGLHAYDEVCWVSFSQHHLPNDTLGLYQHMSDCPGAMGDIVSWSMSENGSAYFFHDLEGALVAYVQSRADGSFAGVVNDGEARDVQVVLKRMGDGSIPDGPQPWQIGRDYGQPDWCRVYFNTRTCVEPEDMGPPRTPEVILRPNETWRTSGDMSAPFLSTPPLSLFVKVIGCGEDTDTDARLWCEVTDGAQVGWILYYDETTLYAQNFTD